MHSSGRVKSPVAPGDVIAGKYRVERVLGAGGMGVVVAARHLELDQHVALKFILPEPVSSKGNVERFMREARAAVRLKSEHVARVYDVGRDADGRPFMVLELLEGMDLAKLNRERGPLPVADAVEYVLQACEALIEAHGAGIVHRDLKPQNLFVTRRLNGSPLVKVLDFGISKLVGPESAAQMSLTDSATIIGSPLYMAPEQMRAERTVDMRTDIWAIGVLLYELVGGQLPFEGETVTALVIKVVNEAPEPLLALRPALDARLADIIMRCLEKDPAKRWQSVAQLASALEPFSRSAKQGGLVRPWRSFEDTADSHERPHAVAALSPDATGPATAVKFEDTIKDAAPAAPKHVTAAGAQVSAVTPPTLMSTDVTWGESTSDPPGKPPRSKAFGAGLAAGAVVTIAAAVAAALLLRASPTPSSGSPASGGGGTTAGALPAAETAATSAAASVASAPSAAGSTGSGTTAAGSDTTTPAISVSALPPVKHGKGPRPAPSGRGTNGAAIATAEPTATAAPAPKKDPDPVSPNGAPILR